MIRTLDEVIHCDRTNSKRTDSGCLHCAYSAKLAWVWLCIYGEYDRDGDA